MRKYHDLIRVELHGVEFVGVVQSSRVQVEPICFGLYSWTFHYLELTADTLRQRIGTIDVHAPGPTYDETSGSDLVVGHQFCVPQQVYDKATESGQLIILVSPTPHGYVSPVYDLHPSAIRGMMANFWTNPNSFFGLLLILIASQLALNALMVFCILLLSDKQKDSFTYKHLGIIVILFPFVICIFCILYYTNSACRPDGNHQYSFYACIVESCCCVAGALYEDEEDNSGGAILRHSKTFMMTN